MCKYTNGCVWSTGQELIPKGADFCSAKYISSTPGPYSTCAQNQNETYCNYNPSCKWNRADSFDAAQFVCAGQYNNDNECQGFNYGECSSRGYCQWKQVAPANITGAPVSTKMNVCTHAPNFYDQP